jgi:hypothetical protein
MKASSLERKDPDVCWLSVNLLVRVEFALYSLGLGHPVLLVVPLIDPTEMLQ